MEEPSSVTEEPSDDSSSVYSDVLSLSESVGRMESRMPVDFSFGMSLSAILALCIVMGMDGLLKLYTSRAEPKELTEETPDSLEKVLSSAVYACCWAKWRSWLNAMPRGNEGCCFSNRVFSPLE